MAYGPTCNCNEDIVLHNMTKNIKVHLFCNIAFIIRYGCILKEINLQYLLAGEQIHVRVCVCMCEWPGGWAFL